MATEIKRDPDLEWLDHVRPVGLVVAPVLLKDLGLAPTRQTQVDCAKVAAHIAEDDSKPALNDPWGFAHDVLGWEEQFVAGSPGGPPLPDDLHVSLPEQATTLSATWAVKELGRSSRPWQLLVRIEPTGVDPDTRNTLGGWEATAHQRFERLLRETGIYAGVLMSEKNERKDGEDRFRPELRLVYAPKGETSGYLSFPLGDLRTVAGRSMLGGLKLLLDAFRLFADASDRRLPALLEKSREAQAAVSTALAEQVLGALHELLRGLDAAAPDLVRELARKSPAQLYEGLLTVLMRLVFVLYAEDRDLLPSRTDGRAQNIYEIGYSVRGLYDRLTNDAALNPDTMDERRGGWGQLLALFRLIHRGHPSHFIQARGGKLFDPEQFSFLEGCVAPGDAPRVLTVSDGCILRILQGLMTLAVKGGGRERLSYRTLDVEQIGSVYETVMGFRAELTAGPSLAIKAGKNNRTPVFVDLRALLAAKGKDRVKYLKEEADRGQLSAGVANAVQSSKTVAELAAALDGIIDERGSPRKHPVAAGRPILQPTDERRRTGSHYTPRTLTAPIVEHALAPAFERIGPAATPERILDLKVCDPAMGSGAFLVESCRALAVRLVQAWGQHPDRKPKNIPPDEDEELHAKRLVAQRCLYGVDKNPLATDLAKLSLWLATLARDHEFTFLDHALKSGDSLVGLTQAQIAAAHWDTSKPGLPLFRKLVKDRVDEAKKGRAEIQTAPDDTARAIQEQRHRSLEERLKDIRLMADAVIAAFFAEDKPRARERKRAEVESWLGGSPVAWDKLASMAANLPQGKQPLTPFHWEVEFPEVFARENGGFDVIVGNPPFLGGARIWPVLGPNYPDWLRFLHVNSGGKAVDLIAHFFRRCFGLIRNGGSLGLIATKTVSQGDTRAAGLKNICLSDGHIYSARKKFAWPGDASVIISAINIQRGQIPTRRILNGKEVSGINSFLLAGNYEIDAVALRANRRKAFRGADTYGLGFIFSDSPNSDHAGTLEDARRLIAVMPQNAEVILPYLGGEELTTDPHQRPNRFAINFASMSLEEARHWPELLNIVEKKVKPNRDKLDGYSVAIRRREFWWQYGTYTPALYHEIGSAERVLAISQTTAHICFASVPSKMVFSQKLIVVPTKSINNSFALLQSRLHILWAIMWGSTQGETPVYSPADCFETFPFPENFETSPGLEAVGRACHDYRAALMVARNQGMTKTYNRFHDTTETAEDIQRLRELHAAMDHAVLEAYGWADLAARVEPVFLDETNEEDPPYQGRLFWLSDFRDEVLARLLALNAERHAEEVRLGIAPGMKRNPGDGSDEDVDTE
jgi:hypothetical protein